MKAWWTVGVIGVMAASVVGGCGDDTDCIFVDFGGAGGGAPEAGPPCSTCYDIVNAANGNPIPLLQNLCPPSSSPWANFAACACSGACADVCGDGLWCAGLAATPQAWIGPTNSCANCLLMVDHGCGGEFVKCVADRP